MKVAHSVFKLDTARHPVYEAFTLSSSKRHRETAKNALVLFLATTLFFYVLFHFSTFFAVAETSSSASFTSIRATHGLSTRELVNGGTAKIYLNQNPVYINLTLHNNNCTINSESFFRILIVFAPYGAWQTEDLVVAQGTSEQIPINLCALYCGSCAQSGGKSTTQSIWDLGANLTQPVVFDFRLHHYSPEADVLEDQKLITLNVVQDFVSVSQEPCKIEKGKTGTLETRVRNLDDDNIYDVNVTILDSAKFSLTPNLAELGTIAGSSSKTAVFNVDVSNETITQPYNLTLKVGYRDLLGVSHVENETVLITVDPEPIFPAVYYVVIAGILVGAVLSVLVLKKKGKINFKNTSK
jgi:hypothetical protein